MQTSQIMTLIAARTCPYCRRAESHSDTHDARCVVTPEDRLTLIKDSSTPLEAVAALLTTRDEDLTEAFLRSPSPSPTLLAWVMLPPYMRWFGWESYEALDILAALPRSPRDLAISFASINDQWTRAAAVVNDNFPAHLRAEAAEDPSIAVRTAVMLSRNCSPELLSIGAQDERSYVRYSVSRHQYASSNDLCQIAERLDTDPWSLDMFMNDLDDVDQVQAVLERPNCDRRVVRAICMNSRLSDEARGLAWRLQSAFDPPAV